MKIKRKPKAIEIIDFEKQYNLNLIVTENQTGWHAIFYGKGVADGPAVTHKSGDGATPDEAILDYVKIISGKRLGDTSAKIKDILVPELTHTKLIKIKKRKS